MPESQLSRDYFSEPRTACARPVLIFSDLLLGSSMTFVRSQAESLTQFVPYYFGSRAVQTGGLVLPADRTVIINRSGSHLGKFKEIPFKVLGYDPVFFWRAQRIRPVLVHAHFGPAAAVGLPLAEFLRVPLLTTFHGYDATVQAKYGRHFHYTFRKYWRKKVLLQRRGALFIAVSEYVRSRLLNEGYPEERTVLHYIGVDTEFFCPDDTVSRNPTVLFVGRLTEKKGCEYLLRAMAKAQRKHPDWKVVVIGEGPLRSGLERLAQSMSLHASFLGVQSQLAVRESMKRASVFCVPSIMAATGDAEGFGIVFAEAQAIGLPVVSFASAGVPEAVAHGESGFLAPEGSIDVLASYLERLFADAELRIRMGVAGRRRVCERFDLRTQTKRLEKLYFRVLQERSEPLALGVRHGEAAEGIAMLDSQR